ncbi:aminoglycoside phosphotransferase family protein [Tateyamaria omphalii]|uniref:Aminoglycoside phosphotransferase n=1 Tax=Tateyamaria omphalii TaxID=299262 RepID=A0A1P8MYD2_9RHOB|nr:phosphotransferase [Tateyamaria omphalii]APX13097.1 aminoglycoside phosphotransferase [Tateyamaria omphalii]
MPDRAELKDRFLNGTGWAEAPRILVAGDASNRKYERLSLNGQTRILMDAPPEKGEDVRPFVDVTQLLRGAGLSAPEIFAQDASNGFLLIEDLGDDLFARLINATPSLETPLYETATDVLLHLHRAATPDLPRYDAKAMTDVACLAFDWYQRGATGAVDTAARGSFAAAMKDALAPLDATTPVLVQRDYHAENLIWLPNRSDVQRVGLLDYQDAMLGHPAYDLVSVLQDARRDVSTDAQRAMVGRYIAGSGIDADVFNHAYALLGLQRNLRILGVFARLSLAYGKPHYVDLIPRVWGHIEANLTHPSASHVGHLVQRHLPKPTHDILNSLKSQCKTIPLP